MENKDLTQQEQENHTPQYDLNKLAKKIKVTRIIYITIFAVSVLGAALYFALHALIPDWGMATIGEVLQKDWETIIFNSLLLLTVGVLCGIFVRAWCWRYEIVVKMYSEPDEQKRSAMSDDFDDLQRSARRIHFVSVLINLFKRH